MANEYTVKLIFDANGALAVSGIKQIENATTKLETSTESSFARMKKGWMGMTASVMGAYMTISKGWQLAQAAAGFQEQMIALDNLAAAYKMTGNQILSMAKESTRGLISMADAAAVTSKSMMMGLDPKQISDFLKIVEKATDVTQKGVRETFEIMTVAAATGRTMTLNQMGIMLKMEDAYKKQADLLKKDITQLSERERVQAGLNAIIAVGTDLTNKLGDAGDTAADKMERFKVQIEDLKLSVGSFLIKGGAALFGVLQGAAAAAWLPIQAFSKLSSIFAWLTDTIYLTKGAFDYWNGMAKSSMKTAEDLAKSAQDNISLLWASTKNTISSHGKGIDESIENTVSKVKEIDSLLRELTARSALIGKEADEADIIRMQQKHQEEIRQLKSYGASSAQLAKAGAVHIAEINALKEKQARDHAIESEKIEADLNARLDVLGKEGFAKQLAELDAQHATELASMRKVKASKELIEFTADVQRLEREEAEINNIKKQVEEKAELELELYSRVAALREDGFEKDLAALDQKHTEELARLRKAKADQSIIDDFAALQKIEREDAIRKNSLEKEKEYAKARADIAREFVNTIMEIEGKLISYREAAGKISPEAAIRGRFAMEHLSLQVQIESLQTSYEQEKKDSEREKIQGQINNLLEKQSALSKYQVYELDALRNQKAKEFRDIMQEFNSLQGQSMQNAFAGINDLLSLTASSQDQMLQALSKGMQSVIGGGRGIGAIFSGTDIYQQEFDKRAEAYIKLEELANKHSEYEEERKRKQVELEVALEEKKFNQNVAIASQGFGAMAGLALSFYALSGKQSKSALAIYQGLAVAQTIIDTYAAAQSAYKSAAMIPVVGPYLAPAMAAIAVAAGMARVAAIKSQTFHSGGDVMGSSGSEVSAILQPKEVVIDRTTSQREGGYAGIMDKLDRPQASQDIAIINVLDDSVVESFLTSQRGRKIIRNVMQK